jgi:hypothetical protein
MHTQVGLGPKIYGGTGYNNIIYLVLTIAWVDRSSLQGCRGGTSAAAAAQEGYGSQGN